MGKSGTEFYKKLLGKDADLRKARKELRHNSEDDEENDDLFVAPDFEALNLDAELHLQTMLSEALRLSSLRKMSDYIV